MLAAEAQEQVWVDHFTEMTQPLVLVEARKRRARGRAADGERVGALAMGNSALPLQIPATVAPEGRHHIAELRMHAAALVHSL
jgi:hypothetical protein